MDEWRLLGCPSPPSSICLPSLSSLSLVFIVRKCSGFQKCCISAQHSRVISLQSPSRHDAALRTPHMSGLAGNTQASKLGWGGAAPVPAADPFVITVQCVTPAPARFGGSKRHANFKGILAAQSSFLQPLFSLYFPFFNFWGEADFMTHRTKYFSRTPHLPAKEHEVCCWS